MPAPHSLHVEAHRDDVLKAELLRRFPELEDDQETLFDTLSGISDLDELIAATMREALAREAFADAIEKLIDAAAARASRFRDGAHKMRDAVAHVMAESGRKKITAPDMTIGLRAGRTTYLVPDPKELPDDLVAIKRRPIMVEINLRMNAGEKIPGVIVRNNPPYLSVYRK